MSKLAKHDSNFKYIYIERVFIGILINNFVMTIDCKYSKGVKEHTKNYVKVFSYYLQT